VDSSRLDDLAGRRFPSVSMVTNGIVGSVLNHEGKYEPYEQENISGSHSPTASAIYFPRRSDVIVKTFSIK